MIRAGVLISGRGSNLKAVLDAQQSGFFKRLNVVCVGTNVKDAPGLQFAENLGIPVINASSRDFSSRDEHEAYLVAEMGRYDVDMLILAGYMRIVGSTLLSRWPNSIVNIHPSLLPSFPGLHAQKQAVDYGVKYSGCTVHFVDAGLDSGPIITQCIVPVHGTDTEESLSQRILVEEHQLYANALKMITENEWTIQGRSVIFA